MTTVEALKEVYTSLGGELTDTYPSIADGAPVSDYVIIPDVISAISVKATGAIELPTTTAEDNGKLLTVVNGAWNKAAASSSLPDVTAADNNKLLTVVDGEWNKAAAPTELPAVSATDNGDVLTVVEGAWAKATPAKSGVPFFTATRGSGSGLLLTLDNGVTKADVYNYIVANRCPVMIGVSRTNSSTMESFVLSHQTGSGFGFTCVYRSGVSATHYDHFVINNDSTSGAATITEETINDPT